MQAILVADYSFTPLEYWRGVSLSARAFITIDPTKRMTSHEALSHDWIAGPAHDRGTEDLLPTVKKNFNARRTLHKAIDTVRAINQLRAGGGMGIMDGAQSHRPERVDTAAPRDKDGDVNMDSKAKSQATTAA
jgi:calcium/calmodulin-dependent protein kinase I